MIHEYKVKLSMIEQEGEGEVVKMNQKLAQSVRAPVGKDRMI